MGRVNMFKIITTVLVGGALLGKAVLNATTPEKMEARKNKAIGRAADTLKDHAVTCHCGGLAIPTEQRGKIRRCVRCNKQFASGGYNLGDTRTLNERKNYVPNNEKLDMQQYEDAVKSLKQEDKKSNAKK